MLEDRQVIEKILKGEKEMFAQLVDRYERLINSIVYGMVYDSDLTADLTQEIFIKSYTKLDTYNPDFNFKFWLTRIAKNHVIDFLRKNKPLDSIDNIDQAHISYSDNDSAACSETKDIVNQAMRQCTDENRMILYLKFHEGFSNEEISNSMNIPEKHIRIKIYRAKEQMKKVLASMGYNSVGEV